MKIVGEISNFYKDEWEKVLLIRFNV
jgi:hypothetical protein